MDDPKPTITVMLKTVRMARKGAAVLVLFGCE